jgi:transposase-like protein
MSERERKERKCGEESRRRGSRRRGSRSARDLGLLVLVIQRGQHLNRVDLVKEEEEEEEKRRMRRKSLDCDESEMAVDMVEDSE